MLWAIGLQAGRGEGSLVKLACKVCRKRGVRRDHILILGLLPWNYGYLWWSLYSHWFSSILYLDTFLENFFSIDIPGLLEISFLLIAFVFLYWATHRLGFPFCVHILSVFHAPRHGEAHEISVTKISKWKKNFVCIDLLWKAWATTTWQYYQF